MYPCVHKGDQENSEATPNFDISKVKKEDPDSSNNMDWQVEDFEGSENNASFETIEATYILHYGLKLPITS